MTSCDRNRIKYVPIQIYSIFTAMPGASVDFYLFHRDMDEQDWEEASTLCSALDRIRFHPVQIEEPEKYDSIASCGGMWCGEAYYSLCACHYIPVTEDRVLYIDAGDVLITDDISPYYGASFDDKMLIVTPARVKSQQLENGDVTLLPYEVNDWERNINVIVDNGCLFNSGCYVINLNKMRRERLKLDDFVYFASELCEILPMTPSQYFWCGDQGFLSAVYLGDMKLFLPGGRPSPAYNFLPAYYRFYANQFDLDYHPAVVHFCGLYHGVPVPKPWTFPYDTPMTRFCSRIQLPEEATQLLDFQPVKKLYQLWYSAAYHTDRLLAESGC